MKDPLAVGFVHSDDEKQSNMSFASGDLACAIMFRFLCWTVLSDYATAAEAVQLFCPAEMPTRQNRVKRSIDCRIGGCGGEAAAEHDVSPADMPCAISLGSYVELSC